MSPNSFIGFPVSRAKFADLAGRSPGHPFPLEDFFWHSFFEGIATLNQLTSGAGTITLIANVVFLKVLSTAGDRARLLFAPQDPILNISSGSVFTQRVALRLISITNSTMDIWVYSGAPNSFPGIGFMVSDGVFSAFTRNGGSPTIVEIDDFGTSGFNELLNLKFVLTSAVKAEFFVDNVLVVTISTNVPSIAALSDILLGLELITPSGGIDGRILAEQADLFVQLT